MTHRWRDLFLEISKYAIGTTLVVTALVTSAAMASSIGSGTKSTAPTANPHVLPISAKLSVVAPKLNLCPTKAQLTGYIHTSTAGPLSYALVGKNGETLGSYMTNAARSAGGGIASFVQSVSVNEPTETSYRIEIETGDKTISSDWVPLSVSCALTVAANG